MSKEMIDVIVLVLADGTTHWFEKKPVKKGQKDPNNKYMESCFQKWNEENREYVENNSVQNAACQIRMSKEKYMSINANDRFDGEQQ